MAATNRPNSVDAALRRFGQKRYSHTNIRACTHTTQQTLRYTVLPLSRQVRPGDWHWNPRFDWQAGDPADPHQKHETGWWRGPGEGEKVQPWANTQTHDLTYKKKTQPAAISLYKDVCPWVIEHISDRHRDPWACGRWPGCSLLRSCSTSNPQEDDPHRPGGRNYRCWPAQLTGRHHGWLPSTYTHTHRTCMYIGNSCIMRRDRHEYLSLKV